MDDEQPISHWYGVCERIAEGPLAEPLNVVSSFLFMVVAVAIFRYYRRHADLERRWIWDIHAMTFITFVIGASSVIFHSFPTPLTELMDTIPIVTFIMIYFTSVLFRIGRCTLFQAAICLVAFVGFSHMLVSQFPRAMNDSIGYLSSMLALIVIAVHLHLRARPSSQYFMLASLIGVISLFCRAIDREVCEQFPFGTHFLWHTCNATLLYILLKQIIRNVNRDARLKQLAGDSTSI
jgi:hypothetical protein